MATEGPFHGQSVPRFSRRARMATPITPAAKRIAPEGNNIPLCVCPLIKPSMTMGTASVSEDPVRMALRFFMVAILSDVARKKPDWSTQARRTRLKALRPWMYQPSSEVPPAACRVAGGVGFAIASPFQPLLA